MANECARRGPAHPTIIIRCSSATNRRSSQDHCAGHEGECTTRTRGHDNTSSCVMKENRSVSKHMIARLVITETKPRTLRMSAQVPGAGQLPSRMQARQGPT